MRYLVTGASGFIGWHLVERLAKEGHAVTAWTRAGRNLWTVRDITCAGVEITNAAAVAEGLKAVAPEVIFHLAAQSIPTRSWADPVGTMQTNLNGTLNLLEAVRAQTSSRPRVIIAGSSSQYASSADGGPIGEEAAVDPGSPYAVSKLAADACGRAYHRAFGLDVIRFRPFFWIGPRKEGDVASDLARRVVAIERGAEAKLAVGRTDVVRDMIDVRDGIEAMVLLAQKGRAGEAYNICAGTGVSIAQLIEAYRRLTTVRFETVNDPKLLRPVDELMRVGDATRIKALGWKPTVPFEQSARDILGYWRAQSRNV